MIQAQFKKEEDLKLKGIIMNTSIILINLEDKKFLDSSFSSIKKIKGVTEVHKVCGEYDIVFIMKADDDKSLMAKLSDEIHSIEGIDHTKTLITQETHYSVEKKNLN